MSTLQDSKSCPGCTNATWMHMLAGDTHLGAIEDGGFAMSDIDRDAGCWLCSRAAASVSTCTVEPEPAHPAADVAAVTLQLAEEKTR